jgi:hypothetical protein
MDELSSVLTEHGNKLALKVSISNTHLKITDINTSKTDLQTHALHLQDDSTVSIHVENGLFTKRDLHGHHYIDNIRMRFSHSWRTPLCAYASLMRSFRWSMFRIFTWYTMAFKPPQVKIKLGEAWRPRRPLKGTTATNPMTCKPPI